MDGPTISAESMTVARIADSHGNHWQYHPQSDRHSKVACWGVLFDLLRTCSLLAKHAATGRVGFGINHTMIDFVSRRQKDLDLVVCTAGPSAGTWRKLSFSDLVADYGVILSESQHTALDSLPAIQEVPVGEVLIALEAKAAMTAHSRAGPRLFDELTSAWQCINGASPNAIAVGYAMVNSSTTFVSPKQNKHLRSSEDVINTEKQPRAAIGAISRVKSLQVRGHNTQPGFDAIGVTVLSVANDGRRVTVVTDPPAPAPSEPEYYDQMIHRIGALYGARFQAI
jgi:hypothetical protein